LDLYNKKKGNKKMKIIQVNAYEYQELNQDAMFKVKLWLDEFLTTMKLAILMKKEIQLKNMVMCQNGTIEIL
jgi:hypothetical protein